MGRTPGQIVVMFALMLPALVGFLGLALDGGRFFVASRAAQFSASAAALAGVRTIQSAQYATATGNGQTIGQRNLTGAQFTGGTVVMAYNTANPNTTPSNCAPTAAGWTSGTPTASTRCVRATASVSFNTQFLRLVGTPSVSLQRVAVAAIGGGVLPIAVCTTTMATSPPWRIWDANADLCGVNNWDGLVNIDGTRTSCSGTNGYETWFQTPTGPPTGPAPATGAVVTLDARNCNRVDNWLNSYTSLLQPIVVVNVSAGRTVVGCRTVQLNPGGNRVDATPIGAVADCTTAAGTRLLY
jgi:hypothetical protein